MSSLTGPPGGPFDARLRWTGGPKLHLARSVLVLPFSYFLSPVSSRARFYSPSLVFRGHPLPPVPLRPLPLDVYGVVSVPSQRWVLRMKPACSALLSLGDPRMHIWTRALCDACVLQVLFVDVLYLYTSLLFLTGSGRHSCSPFLTRFLHAACTPHVFSLVLSARWDTVSSSRCDWTCHHDCSNLLF